MKKKLIINEFEEGEIDLSYNLWTQFAKLKYKMSAKNLNWKMKMYREMSVSSVFAFLE